MILGRVIRFAGVSGLALAVSGVSSGSLWARTDNGAANVVAADASADAGDFGDSIVVTGTRQTGLHAADSPAPIEIVDSAALERAGRNDLVSALDAHVPSFTTQGFGGDASNLKLSARLRGLSPNHALILVNGKRRHGAASLTVSATGGFAGAASADLSFIPVASIDHVEVLTDGAAAQYGTDAIAGVINIILKDKHQGGSLSLTGGAYGAGDGETYGASANIGVGSDNAWFNLTAEYRQHDYSDRGGPDQRLFSATNLANPALAQIPGYPHLNKIFGDARYKLALVSYNSGIRLNDAVELYGNGTFGYRLADANQNYRLPNVAPSLWPQGFTPRIETEQYDAQFTGGIRGTIGENWRWDVSSTWGADYNKQSTLDSANISSITATGTSPKNFFIGKFINKQWTNNADLSGEIDLGLAKPVTLSFGGEFRHESFELIAGDAAARFGTGVQAYPAFGLTDAGKHARDAWAGYIDVALNPVENLLVDIAGRYEHYTDFGDATVGKLTARYDFTPKFALRGTVSSGFRAPTLAEEYYSATNVSPTTAGVKLPPNSAAARLLGIDALQAEKSVNLSLGLVFRPTSRLNATLDAYQIAIDGRIVQTGGIYGLQNFAIRSPQVTAAIVANGNSLDPTVRTTQITTFVNGADTRTRGAEFVLDYTTPIGTGSIDWTVAANYNQTKVRRIVTPPAQIAASGQSYLDPNAISFIETAAPRFKAVLGALFRAGKWQINGRNTFYGKSSVLTDGGNTGHYVENSVDPAVITDLDISYNVTPALRLTVGANNLFDLKPNKVDPITYAESLASGGNGVATTQSFGPYGINGGYYYGRVTLNF
ncbi:MAG TPA: TonB-dependent receptor [Sphingobium sp.]